jgi:hypothetical protein
MLVGPTCHPIDHGDCQHPDPRVDRDVAHRRSPHARIAALPDPRTYALTDPLASETPTATPEQTPSARLEPTPSLGPAPTIAPAATSGTRVIHGFALYVRAHPAFAIQIPKGWTVTNPPGNDVLLEATSPDLEGGTVTVTDDRRPIARGPLAPRAKEVTDAETALGADIIRTKIEQVGGNHQARIEWRLDSPTAINRTRKLLFDSPGDHGIAVTLSWPRGGYSPAWIPIEYSVNPYAGIVPPLLIVSGLNPAEDALNRYIDADNAWYDDCHLASCPGDTAPDEARLSWAIAAQLLDDARQSLP